MHLQKINWLEVYLRETNRCKDRHRRGSGKENGEEKGELSGLKETKWPCFRKTKKTIRRIKFSGKPAPSREGSIGQEKGEGKACSDLVADMKGSVFPKRGENRLAARATLYRREEGERRKRERGRSH